MVAVPDVREQPDTCACGAPVEASYQRHLTQHEYDALPDGLKPIDGIATSAVRCCGDCLPEPICQHPPTDPVPCPVCHAAPGQYCTRPNGGRRITEHRQRAAAQPVAETCTHAHRETCTDPRACPCTGQDEPPVRLPRTFVPLGADQQLAGLGFPLARIPDAVEWIARHQVNPALVRGEFRTGFTQDNQPALLFEYAEPGPFGVPRLDAHGHEIVNLRIEPVELPPGVADARP